MPEAQTPMLIPEIKPNALTRVLENAGLGPVTTKQVMEKMGPLMLKREDLFAEADKILTLDPNLPSTRDKAEDSRKAIKKVRLAGEAARKELGEDFLRGSKAINNIGHAVCDPCETMEAKLEAVEKHARIQEAKMKAELKASRTAILAPFGFDIDFYDLAEMPEVQFTQLHASFLALKKANEEAAAKAAADKAAAETAKLAEEARIREENIRLAKEAEAREAAHKAELAKQEAERKAIEAKAAAEREALEAAARKEREAAELKLAQERREAAERERVQLEAARKEREKIEAAAAEQRRKDEAERAKVQAALEKATAEKAEAEAADRKRIADEAKARKKAEAAPDVAKLRQLAQALRNFPMPTVKSADALLVIEHVSRELAGLAAEIEGTAKSE